MDMKTVTIVADDKVGLLADVSYVLGKAKVNIESIGVEVIADKALISLALSDSMRGGEVLESAGYKVAEANSVVVKLKDEPGELSRLTGMLSADGINIGNVHMLSKAGDTTVLSVGVDKPKRASTLLKNYLVAQETGY
uniref:ACT domain-containing protein n=1 Tax=Candidatus Methanophaga sp. ANME-1 ERB7 TaxID=2759913 RepID=A0A7G9Z2E7_9EURY|nr:hypothetical protein IPKNHHKO_00005 [Methanosarcinales archaeon ANME-1 ERB7]